MSLQFSKVVFTWYGNIAFVFIAKNFMNILNSIPYTYIAVIIAFTPHITTESKTLVPCDSQHSYKVFYLLKNKNTMK